MIQPKMKLLYFFTFIIALIICSNNFYIIIFVRSFCFQFYFIIFTFCYYCLSSFRLFYYPEPVAHSLTLHPTPHVGFSSLSAHCVQSHSHIFLCQLFMGPARWIQTKPVASTTLNRIESLWLDSCSLCASASPLRTYSYCNNKPVRWW